MNYDRESLKWWGGNEAQMVSLLLEIFVKFLIAGMFCSVGLSLIKGKKKWLKVVGYLTGMAGLALIWYWFGHYVYWAHEGT